MKRYKSFLNHVQAS